MTPTGVALERIALALERIALALDVATAPPPSRPVADGCPHPLEARVDFGVTNDVADWQCKACGYRTVAQMAEV